MRTITPIIKPASTACNIRCDYCYHTWNRVTAIGPIMSDAVLRSLIGNLVALQQPHIRFIWHGGEPTCAGLDFYQRAVQLQVDSFTENQRFTNSIQTNGVEIDRDWAEFFKLNRFRVGISLDGPAVIHDLHRQFPNGRGTFGRVLKSIELLQSHGVPIGIVTVVTKTSLSHVREIFDCFYSLGLHRLNFSPTGDFNDEGNLCSYSLTPEEWGLFLIELFDVWLEKDDQRVKIQLIDSFLQSLIGGKSTICICRRDCTDFISIDHNGEVYFCGRFLGNPEFRLGNLQESSLAEIVTDTKLKSISRKVSYIRPECSRCEWLAACNGGCPDHRYLPHRALDAPYYFCKSTQMILSHMRAKLSQYQHSEILAPLR